LALISDHAKLIMQRDHYELNSSSNRIRPPDRRQTDQSSQRSTGVSIFSGVHQTSGLIYLLTDSVAVSRTLISIDSGTDWERERARELVCLICVASNSLTGTLYLFHCSYRACISSYGPSESQRSVGAKNIYLSTEWVQSSLPFSRFSASTRHADFKDPFTRRPFYFFVSA